MLEIDRNKAKAEQAVHNAIGIAAKPGDSRQREQPAKTSRVLHQSKASRTEMVNLDASIRDAEDSDAGSLVQIIAAIMGEFPGCIFDLDSDFPELKKPRSSFENDGGRFWVVERCSRSIGAQDTSVPANRRETNAREIGESEIVGCFGFLPAEDPAGIELQRVYLRPEFRGTGLATRMFKIVQAVAHQRSAHFIELWTDSRFRAAQRFYEKVGFQRLPNERLLNDRSRSSEYHYLLPLR
jgi:putative acetyltransferase